MKIIKTLLTSNEIAELNTQYGNYLKLTVDLDKETVVAGCILHADGENILLRDGGRQEDIWGGGIDLKTKTIDAIAILNLRPNSDNNSLDIIDSKRREKFIDIIKKIFQALWV